MKFNEFVQQSNAKPWKAKRKEIMQMWESLPAYMPLKITPVPEQHEGSRFEQDGIRITGTSQFIQTVISRFKDFLEEDKKPGIKLDVEYRQIEDGQSYGNSNKNYVFYIHVIENLKKRGN